MPRMIVLWVVVLVAVVAGLGLLLGRRAVSTTETQVIERVAARYVAETGAAAADCAARPAVSAGLWLVVACAGYEYFVDSYGRVVDVTRPKAAS